MIFQTEYYATAAKFADVDSLPETARVWLLWFTCACLELTWETYSTTADPIYSHPASLGETLWLCDVRTCTIWYGEDGRPVMVHGQMGLHTEAGIRQNTHAQ